jgi:putative transposase
VSKQFKAYRFLVGATDLEADEMLRMSGTTRFVWNWGLARCQEYYKENKNSLSYFQLSAELTALKQNELWLYDFDAQSLRETLYNLKRAYQNHFNPKMRAGFPKFKTKKDTRQSFCILQQFRLKDSKVYIPKLGWVKIKQSRDIEGKIKRATFKRSATGKWFVIITTEFELAESLPKVSPEQVIGGDLGLCTYLTLSNGTEITIPKFYRKSARKLRKAQKALFRCEKGSRNRTKAKLKVAKIHEQIANIRSNHAHQLSHKLVTAHEAICLENLCIVGLARTKLAKSMLDAAFGQFLFQWKYKSLWNNKHALQADRFFPSTQLCSNCRHQNKELTLDDREWICPTCKTFHKRDLNAALNLRNEGIKQLVALGYMETLNDCGQGVRLSTESIPG